MKAFFLSKIKNFYLGLPKYELTVFLILLFCWLFSLTDNLIKISLKVEKGFVNGYVNEKKWGSVKDNTGQIKNLEINLGNHNLPKPLPFTPEVVSTKFLTDSGEEIMMGKSSKIELPSNTKVTSAEIKLKNSFFAQINFNRVDNSYYYLLYRPFREREVQLGYFQNGKYSRVHSRWRVFLLPAQTTLKYMLKIIFDKFYLFLLWGVLFLLIKRLKLNKKKLFVFRKKLIGEKTLSLLFANMVGIILMVMFLFLVWVSIKYVEKIPHDPDSVGYLWAAKYLASGRFWLPIPSDFFKAHWTINNHWISFYNYGHSLILAPGAFLGIPWVIPPLVGVLFLYFLYALIKGLTNRTVALATVLIAFFSPQFQMHSVNFMSHNSAIFLIIVFLYMLFKIYQNNDRVSLSFTGGFLYYFLFYTRPFTSLTLVPIITLFLIALLIKKEIKFKNCFFLALGFTLPLLINFGTNYLIYGNPIMTTYAQFNLNKFTWGGSGLTINHGLVDSLSYLLVLRLLILPGLPFLFSFLILFSIFNKKFWWLTSICFSCLFLITIGMATYNDVWGIFLGARFWHEMLPFFFILFAISLELIQRSLRKIGNLLVATIVLMVIWTGVNVWILEKQKIGENLIYFTPNKISELRGFNYTDARLIKEAKKKKINNTIIFVKDCGSSWWCYGSVANENSVDLNGNILWVHDLGERNKELLNLHPERTPFLADYNLGTIELYLPTE